VCDEKFDCLDLTDEYACGWCDFTDPQFSHYCSWFVGDGLKYDCKPENNSYCYSYANTHTNSTADVLNMSSYFRMSLSSICQIQIEYIRKGIEIEWKYDQYEQSKIKPKMIPGNCFRVADIEECSVTIETGFIKVR
jgi:hypothetical protein